MKAVALIDEVVAHGGVMRIDGVDIVCSTPDDLPDALLVSLRDHKPEVVEFMTGGRGHLDAMVPPEAWVAGVETMADMPAPLDWPGHLWPGTVTNAQHFLERWGATAAALGWTVNDLFGVYPKAPYRRMDHMGLAVSMWVDRVAVLLPDEAKLWRDGSKLTFRRSPTAADAVPIWEL